MIVLSLYAPLPNVTAIEIVSAIYTVISADLGDSNKRHTLIASLASFQRRRIEERGNCFAEEEKRC